MFTGIITDIGVITQVERGVQSRRFTLACGYDLATVALGASIACSGVCLTVIAKDAQHFTVEISPETLDKTTLGNWQVGTRVNLERALQLSDELGGHIVTGHVDGIGTVGSITVLDDNWQMVLRAPQALSPMIAAKGSVTVDGVSLTVNAVQGDDFTVNIIPHTLQHTTLGTLKTGDAIHLEVDILARYIARQLEYKK